MPPLTILLTILAAYLIGAIPFGYLVARARGVDILQQGSGNIGATNVGRVLGKKYGLLVFVLDFLKGAIPTVASKHMEGDSAGPTLAVIAGLSAFLGHVFPVYLRFRGGKGVATGAGVVAVLVPIPALVALLTWVSALCATRYVSFSSLSAAVLLCAAQLVTVPDPFAPPHRILALFCLVALVLVIVRHRANISRLRAGVESRIPLTSGFHLFTKTIHVLALGLWFGSIVFFTLAALVIFQTFEALGAAGNHRSPWLPLPADFTPEQGTQLAGVAVAPLFDLYFAVQGVCAILALATALGWSGIESAGKVQRIRIVVLMAAFSTVIVGWPVARHVGKLRLERYAADPVIAESARSAFATWHFYSLLLNMTTLVLVAVAMAFAARLPSGTPPALAAQEI
jgi:acyl-phosphate glycerol 3-phosphate acyltransferase